jgi:hypothetical protein
MQDSAKTVKLSDILREASVVKNTDEAAGSEEDEELQGEFSLSLRASCDSANRNARLR